MAKKNEIELVEAARTGDTRALEELLNLHEKQIYRFGLRMCGTEDDAKEVLQETLLSAFQGIHAFRGDAELSTWLYQVARSHCSRIVRKRARGPEDSLELESASDTVAHEGPTPDQESHARQVGEVLSVAIGALPENLREALILRDVEGLTAEEAAAVVGIEVRALKSRLHRARLKVREHLAALLGSEGEAGGGSCPELAEELAAYAGKEIDQSACVQIEDHLGRCPACADACEDLKRTVSICRRIPGDAVPAPVRSAVRQALTRAALG